MSDPDSTGTMLQTGAYVATAGLSSTLTTLFNRWRRREDQKAEHEQRKELAHELKALSEKISSLSGDQALIHRDIEMFAKLLAKHENTNERIALLESSMKRIHERLDVVDPSAKRRK